MSFIKTSFKLVSILLVFFLAVSGLFYVQAKTVDKFNGSDISFDDFLKSFGLSRNKVSCVGDFDVVRVRRQNYCVFRNVSCTEEYPAQRDGSQEPSSPIGFTYDITCKTNEADPAKACNEDFIKDRDKMNACWNEKLTNQSSGETTVSAESAAEAEAYLLAEIEYFYQTKKRNRQPDDLGEGRQFMPKDYLKPKGSAK